MISDLECRRLLAANPNLAVPWFLMAGYCYEIKDNPILSDATWDWLCGFLHVHWDKIEHEHKSFIKRSALNTGSAAFVNWRRVPERVKSSAERVAREGVVVLNKPKRRER